MEKVTFFAAIRNSFVGIFKPLEHVNAERLHGARMFLMIFLLSILSSVILIHPMNSLKNEVDKIWGKLPEFSYANGELYIAQQYIVPNSSKSKDKLIYIDTNMDEVTLTVDTYKDLLTYYQCNEGLFIGKRAMTVYRYGQVQHVKYADIFHGSIDNSNGKPKVFTWINIFITIFTIILIIGYIVVFYFSLLIYALIGKIMDVILKSNTYFVELYKISLSIAFPLWTLKRILNLVKFSGADRIIGWIVRIAILIYIFVVLSMKKQQEQLQAQFAANAANSQPLDLNSFVSNDDLFKDDMMGEPYNTFNREGNNSPNDLNRMY